MYKGSKWAKEILSLQDNEGLWGYIHGSYAINMGTQIYR